MGYPDQALARSQEAIILAQQSAHSFSLSSTLSAAAIFHAFRREIRAAQECAEALIRLATDQGFPLWRARGVVLRGWALAHQGQAKEGIAQLTQGLRGFRATGAESSQHIIWRFSPKHMECKGNQRKGSQYLQKR